MSTHILKYPFDDTGTSPDNFCTEERQLEREYNRGIAPYGGDFYAESVEIFDVATGKKLEPTIDFKTLYPNIEAEARVLEPVHAIIHITNKEYTNVRLEYQVVGGMFSTSTNALVKMMNDLKQDDRKVHWDNIFGKPTEFNPAPHPHHASDIYGMEFVVLALEELRRAIVEGDTASHDIIYDYIYRVEEKIKEFEKNTNDSLKEFEKEIADLKDRLNDLKKQIDKVADDLDKHVKDKNNPHGVTKAQVGLDKVMNYGLATKLQAETGTAHDCYMTPLRSREGLVSYYNTTIKPYVDTHVNDKNNPHGVTKAQVGLNNVDNFPTATKAIAEAGTSNAHFMTPLRTKEAITLQMGSVKGDLDKHIKDKNNPHGVTKSHVGLNNVPNWTGAVTTGAENNISGTQFATPAFVHEVWNMKGKPYVDKHINDKNNPHGVTISQIGALGNKHTVNGKLLSTNPWINAGDVGTYTKEEILALIDKKADKPEPGKPIAQLPVGTSIFGALQSNATNWRADGIKAVRFGDIVWPGKKLDEWSEVVLGFGNIRVYVSGYDDGWSSGDNTTQIFRSGTINYGKWQIFSQYVEGHRETGNNKVILGTMVRVE